jgi:transposase
MTKSSTNAHSEKPVATGGVDTGKQWLDAAIDDGKAPLRCANTDEGRRQLVDFFAARGVRRVGIEASGGYEIEAVAAMRSAGLEVVVFQPAQVRAYAKFLNQRAKTDRIDALLIARCAAAKADVRSAPDPRLEAFAEQLTYIEQIGEDIARQRTRLDRYRDERLITAIKAEIKRLKALERAELRRLRAAVRAHADLAERLDLLVSIDGLGEKTAIVLVIRMPELGSLTNAEAGSLAGMAPVTRESGRWKGESHVQAGRSRVGRAIYAAAQAASGQWNKALVDLRKRIKAQGKHHNVAIVACARKLVTYANAVLARGKPWTKIKAA